MTPRLRVVRDDDDDRPGASIHELERSVIDLAQDVAATCSLEGGIQDSVTEEAVLRLCDAVNGLNASIVTQGCPPTIASRTGSPGA